MALPTEIYQISKEEFDAFKKEHLDKKVLDEDDLELIKFIFKTHDVDPASRNGGSADFFYANLDFNHPEAAVVYRLILEIRQYKEILRE